MSVLNQRVYTNIPRTGTLPAPALPAPPPRRYNLRSSTVTQAPQSEVRPTESSDPTVWEIWLPVSRALWQFPGHIGRHRRRIKELEGAWYARGEKILGLDCDDVLVTDEADDSDTIVVATPPPSKRRRKPSRRSLPQQAS